MAISIVIVSHIAERYHWPNLPCPDAVGIFFVLSGFLITTLLLREYDRNHAISLRRFYARRCFRILPPFYTYIAFLLVFFWIERKSMPWAPFIHAALFLRDYSTSHFWAIDHLWSLGVEEQFYILWPAFLIWGLKKGGRKGAAKVAIACIVLAPVLRIGGELTHISYLNHRIPLMFHCRMDSLMCGCLVAIWTGTPRFEEFFEKISKFWWIWFTYTFIVTPFLFSREVHFWMSIGLTLDAISASLLILWLTRNADSLLGKFLNTRLLATMGVLSYSAYLWQSFFIHPLNSSFLARMPFALAWIWVAAWLSYRFIEQPALRLRDRVVRRKPRIAVPQSVA